MWGYPTLTLSHGYRLSPRTLFPMLHSLERKGAYSP